VELAIFDSPSAVVPKSFIKRNRAIKLKSAACNPTQTRAAEMVEYSYNVDKNPP